MHRTFPRRKCRKNEPQAALARATGKRQAAWPVNPARHPPLPSKAAAQNPTNTININNAAIYRLHVGGRAYTWAGAPWRGNTNPLRPRPPGARVPEERLLIFVTSGLIISFSLLFRLYASSIIYIPGCFLFPSIHLWFVSKSLGAGHAVWYHSSSRLIFWDRICSCVLSEVQGWAFAYIHWIDRPPKLVRAESRKKRGKHRGQNSNTLILTFQCHRSTSYQFFLPIKISIRVQAGSREEKIYIDYQVYIIKIKIHSSCEIEYFVETHLCKLRYVWYSDRAYYGECVYISPEFRVLGCVYI